MSAFVLKIIACVTMFIDHISYIIPGDTDFLNYIGRFAFPIFAFQISEGYIHTRDIKKYIFRLAIFAIISQIPYMLFYSIFSKQIVLNVIFTLLLGLISILIYDKFNKYIGIFCMIFLCLIAQITHCDYGFYGILLIFLFFITHNNKILLSSSFIIATAIYYLYIIIQYVPYGLSVILKAYNFYLPYAICTMFAIIPILLYNNKKGPNIKYLLYLFYPLHLLLIYVINCII